MDPIHGSGDSPAERLFAEHLARQDAGRSADIDALCASHPADADELRRLASGWEHVRAGLLGDLSRRISERFGSDVEPAIELEPEGEAETRFRDEMLERLAGRRAGFGRYRLKGEVARGGQGVILRVWDTDLRRHLAMKVVLGSGSSGAGEQAAGGASPTPPVDTRTLGRFLEEAQVTGQLDHPGIVPVHELGLDADDRVYFTMKLVKGESLREVFGHVRDATHGWTRTRALGVLLRVCEAVSFAHAKGVLHRDLKPANVMVGRFGEVYVMDWGLARVQGRTDPAASSVDSERREVSPLLTRLGDVVGTPAYMSPEQARGEHLAVGPSTDVYAIGAMLYHLLAGRRPYQDPGEQLGAQATLERVRVEPPRPLAELAGDVPPELAAVCERAMARVPGQRYASAAQLADDLRAWLEGRVVAAYERGALAELRKWIGRNRAAAAAVLAVVLGAVAGAVAVDQASDARHTRLLLAETEQQREIAEDARAGEQAAKLELAAALAGQRGEWLEVLAHVAAARGTGHGDAVSLGLRAARAHLARRAWAEAAASLETVREQPGADERLGEQHLLGALVVAGSGHGTAGETTRDQLEAALDEELAPADFLYAQAILAPTLDQARTYLEAALEQDPVHVFARSDLLAMTFLAGRLDQATVLAEMYARIYPKETTPWVVQAFIATLQGTGDGDQALGRLDAIDTDVAEEARLAVAALAGMRELVTENLRGFVASRFMGAVAIGRDLAQINAGVERLGRDRLRSFFGFATLDSLFLEQSWGRLAASLSRLLVGRRAAGLAAMEAAELSGNAFFSFLGGLNFMLGGRMDDDALRTAHEAFIQAATRGFYVPELEPVARHLQLMVEAALMTNAQPAAREPYRLMVDDSLHWLAARDDLVLQQLDDYSDLAMGLGNYELARRLAVRWISAAPDDPEAVYRRVEAESKVGAPALALRYARQFKARAPDDERADALVSECEQKFRATMTELGFAGQ